MAIITISHRSYSHGKEIAEKVSQKLGYSCITRDLVLKTSQQFSIPEIPVTRAVEDVPSIFDRFKGGREMSLAFMEAALLEYAQKDNMVYYGLEENMAHHWLAGHFILRQVKHVLHVRITANTEDRAHLLMEREKVSYGEALRLLKKIDRERKRWGMALHGIDLGDSINYDLVINVDKITVDNTVDTICQAVGWEQFKTTPGSQRALDDLALAATMKAKLLPVLIEVAVTVQNGIVLVKGKTNLDTEARVMDEIREIAHTIPGVADLRINLDLTAPTFP